MYLPKLIGQEFSFNLVLSTLYRESCCRYDAHTCVRIIYICFFYIICMYKIPKYLMYYLYACVWLWIPSEIRFSLNSIILFYQANFKLVTKEFYPSFMRDSYWPCIYDQTRSFCQVFNRDCFLVVILSYFKPLGCRVYHYNRF